MCELQVGDIVKLRLSNNNPLVTGFMYRESTNDIEMYHFIPQDTNCLIVKVNITTIDLYIPGINKFTTGWSSKLIQKI